MNRPLAVALVLASAVGVLGAVSAPAYASSCGRTEYQDGTLGPSVCPDGGANQAVAKAYTKAAPAIMALSPSSTRKQIQAAVCADRRSGASGPTLYDAVEFQAADHAWKRYTVNAVNRRLLAGHYC